MLKGKSKNRRVNETKKKWNPFHLFILVLLTSFGLFLRCEPVIYDTVHFSYDQGDDLVEVRNLLLNHKLSLIGRASGMEGVFMGPLWTWILAIPYAIGGGNPSVNVLFFALIGTLAIWFTYVIVKRIADENAAIISSFFVALSGNFVGAAHIVLSPSPITVFMIFYLWFLWEVAINKNKQYFPWLGLMLGIFFQFEIAFALFMIPATAIVIMVFLNKNTLIKKPAFIALLLFFLTFVPQIVFDLRHNFLMSKAIIAYFTGGNVSLGKDQSDFLLRCWSRLGSLWQDYSSAIAFNEKNTLILGIISILAVFGWFKILKQKNYRSLELGLQLLVIIISLYGGLTLYPGPVWGWYRTGMPMVFVLLISVGWGMLLEKSLIWRFCALLMGLILVFTGVIPQTHSFRIYAGQETGGAILKAQKQAIDFIFQNASDKPFDLYVYTPPVYTYVWDHMLHWYAKSRYENQPVDYGYRRSPAARNDFYLLIEPDYLPTRIDGWKGNFMSFGIKENEWLLTSGIKIEKWKAGNK